MDNSSPTVVLVVHSYDDVRAAGTAHARSAASTLGDEPGWTLRPNKYYGFFLLYRRDSVPLGEVRQLIEATFGYSSGPTFIIGDLPERTAPHIID